MKTMKYLVVHIKDDSWLRCGFIVGQADTLQDAAMFRKVSADIVVDSKTFEIINDPAWMKSWEAKASSSYVQRAIADRRKITIATA